MIFLPIGNFTIKKNFCAGWKIYEKLINVQYLIRMCRLEKFKKINKRACTAIRGRGKITWTNIFNCSASNTHSTRLEHAKKLFIRKFPLK